MAVLFGLIISGVLHLVILWPAEELPDHAGDAPADVPTDAMLDRTVEQSTEYRR